MKQLPIIEIAANSAMPPDSTRRRMLLAMALFSGGLAGANGVMAGQLIQPKASRALTIYNVWTRKETTFLLGRNEPFRKEWLQKLNYSLRDHHNGRVGRMDPLLITSLMNIQDILGLENPTFEVLSAYRSKQTHAALRKRGHRVARQSLHLQGKALDFRIRDIKMRDLRDAALDLKLGGVGYYRRFVHFDTGPRRRW